MLAWDLMMIWSSTSKTSWTTAASSGLGPFSFFVGKVMEHQSQSAICVFVQPCTPSTLKTFPSGVHNQPCRLPQCTVPSMSQAGVGCPCHLLPTLLTHHDMHFMLIHCCCLLVISTVHINRSICHLPALFPEFAIKKFCFGAPSHNRSIVTLSESA